MPEGDMTIENPFGTPEGREVARAFTELGIPRTKLPMERSSSSGGFGPLSGEPIQSFPTPESSVSPEEREKRERRAAYLSGFAERLSITDDPAAMHRLVREFMASLEKVIEMPDVQRIDMIRNVLAEKAIKFRDAQDPEYARLTGLDREGLVERVVVRDVLQPDGKGGLEMLLSGKDVEAQAEQINKDAGSVGILPVAYKKRDIWKITVSSEERIRLVRLPEAGKILERQETTTTPALYTKPQLETIAKTAEELRKEIFARTRIFIAYYLYQNSSFSLSLLTGLDARYTGISTDEWKTLVTLKETKEGELAYGDKIDAVLRLLCLVAEIGGDKEGGEKLNEGDYKGREEKLKQLINKQPQYLQDLVNTYSEIDGEDGKKKSGVEWLMKISKKNVFAKPVSGTYDLKKVRETLEKIVSGDKSDTQAAGEIAYRLFRMWGIAAHYDCRNWKEDKRTGRGALVPFGPAVSDCTAGLQYFELDRMKDLMDGYPHGPDATLGRYPEAVMGTFLHSAGEGRDFEFKSLWKKWWEEGVRLGKEDVKDENGRVIEEEFPWDKIGNGAWFRYNFQLSNAGKEKTGFYTLATEPPPTRDLINVKFLQEVYRTVDRAIAPVTVHGGDPEAWLSRQKPEDIRKWRQENEQYKREKLRKMSPEDAREWQEEEDERKRKWLEKHPREDISKMIDIDFDRQILEPLKKRIRELILIGAITSAYQNARYAYRDWGIFVPSGVDGKDKDSAEVQLRTVQRVLVQANIGLDWERVVQEAEDFLKKRKLL